MRAAALAVEEAGFDGVWTWDHLRDPDDRRRRRRARGDDRARRARRGHAADRARAPRAQRVHPPSRAARADGGDAPAGLGRTSPARARGGRAPQPPVCRRAGDDRARRELRRGARPAGGGGGGGDAPAVAGRRHEPRGRSVPAGAAVRVPAPDPAPPIVVGGFGPRMAAIAGRHADGFNTQARHPNLAGLLRIARDEHRASGRDPARFVATRLRGARAAMAAATARRIARLSRRWVSTG